MIMAIEARPVPTGKFAPSMSRLLRGERYQMRTTMRVVTIAFALNTTMKVARFNGAVWGKLRDEFEFMSSRR